MKFNLLRFHQVGLRSVWGNLYVGAGVRIDRYFAIVDQSLDLAAPSPVITSHYAYSTYFGFDPSEYTLSGVTVNAVYDSRDSTINAYRGIYAQLALGGFPTWLGSTREARWSASTSAPTWGSPRRCPGTCSPSGCSRAA